MTGSSNRRDTLGAAGSIPLPPRLWFVTVPKPCDERKVRVIAGEPSVHPQLASELAHTLDRFRMSARAAARRAGDEANRKVISACGGPGSNHISGLWHTPTSECIDVEWAVFNCHFRSFPSASHPAADRRKAEASTRTDRRAWSGTSGAAGARIVIHFEGFISL